MIIVPLSNFSANGVLKGGLAALDDTRQPLGWEATGNWSDRAFFQKQARDLHETTGCGLDYSRALLTQAVREGRRQAGVPDPAQVSDAPSHELRPIVVNGRHLRDISHESFEVLQEANIPTPHFFVFGNSLCDLIQGIQGPTVRSLTPASLRNRLARLADYISIDKFGDEHPDRPRRELLEDMLVQDLPPVPGLKGLVRGPVCRQNGSILNVEGYDSETGLYLSLVNLKVPAVPQTPSDRDVVEARALILDDLLVGFPFASESDLAHAVAELLTLPARQMIDGPTPLFCNEAPTPGTGKDLLVDVVSIIHTGAPTSAMTEGRDDEEWRKRLTAKLINAPSIILIDNVKQKLDSGALSAAIERPIWEDRYLGTSRMVEVPIICIWVCTGNNPTFSDEIARRVVRVRLDPGMERPWERDGFKHPNLRKWVMDNRGRLLWAVFTLIRAWVVRGMPKSGIAMGSFESWAGTIGGILEVAGIPGFLGNRREVYAQAHSELEDWTGFLLAWWEAWQDRRVSVEQLFGLGQEIRLLSEIRAGRGAHGAMVALGKLLSANRDRVIGDYRIVQSRNGHRGSLEYRLKTSQGRTEVESNPANPAIPGLN